MKIFKYEKTVIHDHYIVFALFVGFLLILVYNDRVINTQNCHILEPSLDCNQKGVIPRANATSNPIQWTYIPWFLNYNGHDAYRENPSYGFEVIYCTVGNATCEYHTDTFNAVGFPFSTVAHVADFLDSSCNGLQLIGNSSCFGLPDYILSVTIWSVAWFGGYYIFKHMFFGIRYLVKKYI